jgi:hypothetical protein
MIDTMIFLSDLPYVHTGSTYCIYLIYEVNVEVVLTSMRWITSFRNISIQ